MSAMVSHKSPASRFYSTVCSAVDQRKHQSSASLAFVRGIHWWPVDSPFKWPVTRKMFHLMASSCLETAKIIGVIDYYRTTTKHNKAQTKCIKLLGCNVYMSIWMYFMSYVYLFNVIEMISDLTHLLPDKTAAISQTGRHFQMHFLERKVLYFDSNFTEVCSEGSNWQ